MDAWPFERTKRSRSHHPGFPGLNLSTSRQSTSATSASPMGAPGWPELAFWTASIDKARMALARSRRVGMTSFLFNKCDGEQAAYCPRCAPRQQCHMKSAAFCVGQYAKRDVGRELPTERVHTNVVC